MAGKAIVSSAGAAEALIALEAYLSTLGLALESIPFIGQALGVAVIAAIVALAALIVLWGVRWLVKGLRRQRAQMR